MLKRRDLNAASLVENFQNSRKKFLPRISDTLSYARRLVYGCGTIIFRFLLINTENPFLPEKVVERRSGDEFRRSFCPTHSSAAFGEAVEIEGVGYLACGQDK